MKINRNDVDYFNNMSCALLFQEPRSYSVFSAVLRHAALRNTYLDKNYKFSRLVSTIYGDYDRQLYPAKFKELSIVHVPYSPDFDSDFANGEWECLNTSSYPVSEFLTAIAPTKVFINRLQRKAVVFTEANYSSNQDSRFFDALASCLFRIVPWRFRGGVTYLEEEMFRAISLGDINNFVKIINRLFDLNAITDAILNSLDEYEDSYRISQIEELKLTCLRLLENIAQKQKQLGESVAAYNKIKYNLSLFEQSSAKPFSLKTFFKEHKNITITGLEGFSESEESHPSEIKYCVCETLEFYDLEEFLRQYNNERSHIGSAPMCIKRILKGLFLENKGKLRVEAAFILDGVANINPMQYEGYYHDTHIPNPHLAKWRCFGGNSQYITEYLLEGEIELAIEQTIAATKNINFSDSIVMGTFIGYLNNVVETDGKYIIADNGVEMSLKEFYQYLKSSDDEVETNG